MKIATWFLIATLALLLLAASASARPMPGPKTYGASQHPRTLKAQRTVQQHVKTMRVSYLDARK